MHLDINLKALEERLQLEGRDRAWVRQYLASRLEITPAAAEMRLQRLSKPDLDSVSTSLLAELIALSSNVGLQLEALLQARPELLFDLFPAQETTIYIGAYGPPQLEHGFVGPVTTSVLDHRAARKLASRLTTNWEKLRFSPSLIGDRSIIRRITERELERSEADRLRIISLGSAKSSSISEYIMARALGLIPMEELSETHVYGEEHERRADGLVPFRFIYPERFAAPARIEDFRQRTMLGLTQENGEAFVWWNQTRHTYQPASESSPGSDFAVVFLHARSSARMVIAGLSALGTYGAAAFCCDHEKLLPLPTGTSSHVRAYLIEVHFRDSVPGFGIREPTAARCLSTWTQTSGVSGTWENLVDRRASKGWIELG